jgi:hypothetical protein
VVLLELTREPERYQAMLDQLTELNHGQGKLARRTAGIKSREKAADAKAAEADRVRADFGARAARLHAVLNSS